MAIEQMKKDKQITKFDTAQESKYRDVLDLIIKNPPSTIGIGDWDKYGDLTFTIAMTDIGLTYNDYNTYEDEVFSYFMNNLRNTITTWEYFINWAKVFGNIKQIEVDERRDVTDADLEAIMMKYLKQREDAKTQFADAGRDDLVAKEDVEIAIVKAYLPEPMDDSELEGASDKNLSRDIIKRNFKNRECHTLVVPSTDDQRIKRLENEEKSHLRPEFIKQVDELIQQLRHKDHRASVISQEKDVALLNI